MREPPKPTDAEMDVYDAGLIEGVIRRKKSSDIEKSDMFEVFGAVKSPIYLTPGEAEQILCFDPHQPGVLQIHPDIATKCEVWLAWKAEQDAARGKCVTAGDDESRDEGEMSKERAMIRDMVAAELATQRGPHGKFREIVRRIVREQLADAIKDEMQEMRDAIANATGDDDAAPECTCAAKDMTFGRCCKVTPNAALTGHRPKE